ncbi:MAG: MotA/TolQ/ExbB proton channel family protein [Acidobacteriota bacterium]|nr:MotA/TolQ/ExbB proton channel family protein [Acidobacteriota bacterium]MDH3784026.1 MotA/TolQ/ExbB proton channel family protein [Acidobacteriota bacterium]
MNLNDMFSSIGFVGLLVLGCLLLLSLYSFAVILDKYRRFNAGVRQSIVFSAEFNRHLQDGKLQEAANSAKRHEQSPVARVVSAGVQELIASRNSVEGSEMQLELVTRALDRSAITTLSDMKKGLGALATIGSTAPFIGLFGTVVGIIHAFDGIAESGSGGIAAVSGGISEALVATAFGILVATPAVMAFNYFTGSLERVQIEMHTRSAELVDFITKRMNAVHAGS